MISVLLLKISVVIVRLQGYIMFTLVVQGDTLDFDPYLTRYCHIVETRGLFYWNPHAIPDNKH